MFSGITLYEHTVTIIFRTKTVRKSCDSPRIVSECCICIIVRFDYKSGRRWARYESRPQRFNVPPVVERMKRENIPTVWSSL